MALWRSYHDDSVGEGPKREEVVMVVDDSIEELVDPRIRGETSVYRVLFVRAL